MLESADSFRIVRVTDRRPAGCKPFDEVEPSIRRKLEQQQLQRIQEDVYRKATIESPYLSGSQTKPPEQAAPSAWKNDLPPIGLTPWWNVPESAAHQKRS